ncbi:hypothetical protein AAMO2058_000191100 [Amorphochlora amoebiformis]
MTPTEATQRGLTSPPHPQLIAKMDELVRRGMARVITDDSLGYYSISFVKEKRQKGRWRLLNDLRNLNRYVVPHRTKLHGLSSANRLITPMARMITLDVTDGYYNGFRDSQRAFVAWMRPHMETLRQAARAQVRSILQTIRATKLPINLLKCNLTPLHEVTYLGFLLNSRSMTVKVPTAKARTIEKQIKKTLRNHWRGTLKARLYLRRLQIRQTQALRGSSWRLDPYMTLDLQCITELQWWLDRLRCSRRQPLRPPITHTLTVLATDASRIALAAALISHPDVPTYTRTTTHRERRAPIHLAELKAAKEGRSSSPPGPILGERHNRPPSPLASCPMVQQGRATIGQPPTPPIPGCHHPFTPICSLTPELGMDWGAALRQAEQKANVPEGVGTRFRIHHNTYRQYAGAWAALRAFAQNTQIPPTLPRHRPTSEILNHTVALYAAHLTKKGASQSQLTHASAAVRHYTATLSATPDDIRAWAARRMNRDRPSIPRNDTVPSIHDLLDIAIRIPAHNRIELRDRTIALFLLFTHARQSDITGIYRHHATFRVGHLPLDAPSWARGPSRAAPMLTRLGYIPDYKHRSNHHVYVDVRYHLPKRAAAQGLRYGNWVRLLEQPFSPSTCPVYHLARYLTATKALDIDAVPLPNHEHEEFRARPLFVSEGRQHHELKESTIGGIIRRRVIQYIYGRKFTPHITRACSASYKIAYGVPRDTVKMIGNWTTDEAFNKHYLRVTYPPVHHARLTDALYHDWAIARAHQLYTTQKLTTTSSQ